MRSDSTVRRPVHTGLRAGAVLSLIACLPIAAMAGSANGLRPGRARCGFAPAQVARVDRLLRLIQKRLDMAPGDRRDARWRRCRGSRTARARSADRRSAKALGRRSARGVVRIRFAQAQIDAGKIIQAERAQAMGGDPSRAEASGECRIRCAHRRPSLNSATPVEGIRATRCTSSDAAARALLDARAADLIHVGGPTCSRRRRA
jgi:hypothetical protein